MACNAFLIGRIQIKIKTLLQIQMIENITKFGQVEGQIIIGLILIEIGFQFNFQNLKLGLKHSVIGYPIS